jgi:hypothetical protein
VANTVEILLTAKNATGTAFHDAQAQIAYLNAEVGRLNPTLGGAVNQLGGLSAAAGGLREGLGGLLGMGALLFGAAKRLGDEALQLERLARQSHASIPDLQVLEASFKKLGIEPEAAGNALYFMTKAMAEHSAKLRELRVTATDPYQAFLQLVAVMQNLGPVQRQRIADALGMARSFREWGGSVVELLPVIRSLDQLMGETGEKLSTGMTAKADQLRESTDTLSHRWAGLMTTLGGMTAPTARMVVGGLDEMLKATVLFARAVREQAVGAIEDLSTVAAKVAPPELLPLPGGATQSGAIERGQYGIEATARRVPVLSEEDRKAAEKAAEKQRHDIEAIAKDWGIAADQAALYYAQLKKIGDIDSLDKARKGLGVMIEALNKNPTASAVGNLGLVPHFGMGEKFVNEQLAQDAARVPYQPPRALFGDSLRLDLQNMKVAMHQALSLASATREALDSVLGGLSSGLETVFSNLIGSAQTLRSALVTIFKSLVSEIARMLAKLAAEKIFEMLLNLFTGGVGGSALSSTGGLGSMIGSLGMVAAPAASSGMRAPLTVNISALDAKGVAAALIEPRGTLRAALGAVALAGAF